MRRPAPTLCKHLGAVQRRAAREGWPFGQIAPLSRVERYFPLSSPAAPRATCADERRERARRARADLYGEAAD